MTALGRVLLAGGGTAGHVFPGLALAEALRRIEPEIEIALAGRMPGVVREKAEREGVAVVDLPGRPAPDSLWNWPGFVAANLVGFRRALKLIDRFRPNVVVGLGGFASAATVRAALFRGIPLVLLEQNAVPGRVTRWIAPRASHVFHSFSEATERFDSSISQSYVGNPVRSAIAQLAARSKIETARTLVILGGSGGARWLNEVAPAVLGRLAVRLAGWSIVHQSGPRDAAATEVEYRRAGLSAVVVPFIDDMATTLGTATLAICRAGGTTLAELACAGVPAILAPYRFAADDHQRRNAKSFECAGAAMLIDAPEELSAALGELISNSARLGAMRSAMQRIARPDAADQIARHVLQLIARRVETKKSRGRVAAKAALQTTCNAPSALGG